MINAAGIEELRLLKVKVTNHISFEETDPLFPIYWGLRGF